MNIHRKCSTGVVLYLMGMLNHTYLLWNYKSYTVVTTVGLLERTEYFPQLWNWENHSYSQWCGRKPEI